MKRRWRRQPRPTPDAQAAVEQAARVLKELERVASYGEELASRVTAIGARNHFAAAVAKAIQGGRT